jgi:hypothetical protein
VQHVLQAKQRREAVALRQPVPRRVDSAFAAGDDGRVPFDECAVTLPHAVAHTATALAARDADGSTGR